MNNDQNFVELVKLKCPKCGNTKKFYRDVSVSAKLRVDSNGNDLKTVYDIDKYQIDNHFDISRCYECDAEVLDEVPIR